YARLRIDATSPIAEAFRGGSALWIPNSRIFDTLYPHLTGARSSASGAWAILPLRSGGAAIGVVGLIFPDAHSWSSQQKTMIESAGAIMAQALERARLLEAELRARE